MRKIAALSLLAAAPFALAAAAFAEPAPQANDPYFAAGQSTLTARASVKPNKKRAKNVILFVGDGMDPTTVAASRIFDGQSRGEAGEENLLSFERFPYIAMSKTYTTSHQVADSAGTMAAMMTGVKTKSGVIAVTDAAEYDNCKSGIGAKALTVGELSEMAGLATGVVTTARLTHATPANVYSHAASREWESDADLSEEAKTNGCPDIASQLIDFPYGDGLEVAMGGGRAYFMTAEEHDPEYPERSGRRRDGRDLTQEWTKKSADASYVWNKSDFSAIDPKKTSHLLGLFEQSHMQYEADREHDAAGEPSLAEMTTKAIDILSQNKNGYFLMVEAGRIDHASHAGNAARALRDTQALSEAVAAARAHTKEADTLIIVTADHGHTMTFAGYAKKGSNILGLATASYEDENSDAEGHALALDGKPYTTLGYANGPGSVFIGKTNDGGRPLVTDQEAADLNYRQQSLTPFQGETHGGQDVLIFADGPKAYLFGGVVEQNYIFHVINDALGLTTRAGRK
ncbi:MAG: alkaline phosphatase [Parvularculaceae bacterium]